MNIPNRDELDLIHVVPSDDGLKLVILWQHRRTKKLYIIDISEKEYTEEEFCKLAYDQYCKQYKVYKDSTLGLKHPLEKLIALLPQLAGYLAIELL